MKIHLKNIIRPIFIVGFILSVTICPTAQTKKSKNSRPDWQKHETEAIDYAKKYLVSNLDPKLPPKSFEVWFQSLFDDSAPIDWQVNDCGEQSGSTEDRDRDFPMCVSAETQTGEFFHISVNIQLGMFSSGISRETPVIRHIIVGDRLDGEMFYVLSDLPEKIKSNRIKRQYLDPNDGVFIISGEKPAGFKKFAAMWIETMAKNANRFYVAVKQNGGIKVGENDYAMREIYFNGKNLSFKTVRIGGVSFKFGGEFAKLKFDSNGDVLGENVLHGRLSKFVKGKKAVEAKLVLSWVRIRTDAIVMPNRETQP